jgi:hypothetical protein
LVEVIGAVVIPVPLVGELEISLPPCVVPTEAEVEPAKLGIRLTVAPKSGVVDEAVIEEVADETKFTVVIAVLLVSSVEVAVIVTLPAALGAVQVPVLEFIVPALADQLSPFVTPPLAVVVKIVVLFTVFVGAAGAIALTTTICGVTVTELST